MIRKISYIWKTISLDKYSTYNTNDLDKSNMFEAHICRVPCPSVAPA